MTTPEGLVARLRTEAARYPDTINIVETAIEAADRIEALEARLAATEEQVIQTNGINNDYLHRAGEAEARLAAANDGAALVETRLRDHIEALEAALREVLVAMNDQDDYGAYMIVKAALSPFWQRGGADMSDIVERLRSPSKWAPSPAMCEQAADRIEALEAALRELMEWIDLALIPRDVLARVNAALSR